MDGPVIERTADLPVAGNATYNGAAQGIYTARWGSDFVADGIAEGSLELGDFGGDLTLTADFGASSISGSIENIWADFLFIAPGEEPVAKEATGGYRVDMGATPIGSDGTFPGNRHHPRGHRPVRR